MRANEESVHDYRNWIGQGKLAIKFCDKRLHRCDFAANSKYFRVQIALLSHEFDVIILFWLFYLRAMYTMYGSISAEDFFV